MRIAVAFSTRALVLLLLLLLLVVIVLIRVVTEAHASAADFGAFSEILATRHISHWPFAKLAAPCNASSCDIASGRHSDWMRERGKSDAADEPDDDEGIGPSAENFEIFPMKK